MKKLFYMVVAAATLLGAAACGNKADNKAEQEAQEVTVVGEATDGVATLTDDNLFRPDSKVALPIVLDFNATWCVPCKKLTPAYHQVAEQFPGKVGFYSVDIEANPETAKAFNIESVPTVVILMPNGTSQRHVGLGDFIAGSLQESELGATPDSVLTPIIAEHLESMVSAQLK